jgi:hypothetical protein
MRRWGIENPRRQDGAFGDEKGINKGGKGEKIRIKIN